MSVFFNYVDWTLEDVPRPFYVGKGNLSRVQKRERNAYWKNIVAKYGWRREVVFATKDEHFAFEEEKRRILELGTFDDGTPGRWGANLTEGGEGASGYTHTLETKLALAKLRQGKEPWNKGVTHSEETCLLISQKATGRKLPPRSDDVKARQSAARKGKRNETWCQSWSQERRENYSLSYRGDKHHSYGKLVTEEIRQKIRVSKSQLTPDVVRMIRESNESCRIAGIRFGVSEMTVSRIRRRLRYGWVV